MVLLALKNQNGLNGRKADSSRAKAGKEYRLTDFSSPAGLRPAAQAGPQQADPRRSGAQPRGEFHPRDLPYGKGKDRKYPGRRQCGTAH